MKESQRANVEWEIRQRPKSQSVCKTWGRPCSDEEIEGEIWKK